MQGLPTNAEDVIKKWQSHSLPGKDSGIIVEELKNMSPILNTATNEKFANRRARRKLKSKPNENIVITEITHMQKKFRLQPPTIRDELPKYETFMCKYCKDLYVLPKKQSECNNKTLDLLDYTKAHIRNISNEVIVANDHVYDTSISTLFVRLLLPTGVRYVKNIFKKICYQKEDKVNMKEISKEKCLFVFEGSDGWKTFLTYLYVVLLTQQVPITLIDSRLTNSLLIRWLMRKLGFIFIKTDMKENLRERISKDLIKVMHTTSPSVLACLPRNNEMMSEYASIFKDIILESRVNKSFSNIQIIPMTVSCENLSKLELHNSIFSYWSAKKTETTNGMSLLGINIAKPLSFKLLLKATTEMLPPTPDEEFNIITRVLRHSILNSCAIFPANILSFLLLYKYGENSIDGNELNNDYEAMVNKLIDVDRNVGYVGDTNIAVKHAIQVLHDQDFIQLLSNEKITISSKFTHLQKLHELSRPLLQALMMKSILGSSLIACVGGQVKLSRMTAEKLVLEKDVIVEKIINLSEFIAYLLDFFCPLTEIENHLDDFLSDMPVLKLVEESFENQRHQKLLQNIDFASNWEDEEDESHGYSSHLEKDISYELSTNFESCDLLQFSNRLILPYMELYYVIVLMLKETFRDKCFTVVVVFECLLEKFQQGTFRYGEVISQDYVSRVFDYLYEKDVIDEYEMESTSFVADTSFVLSNDYKEYDYNFHILLTSISVFT